MAETAPHRIVVVGGGYAGLTTAARIGETVPGIDLTLIDAKTQFVERIRLHEIAGGSTPKHLDYADFMAARNGRFVQARVLDIDASAQTIRLAPHPGAPDAVAYDILIYAPGSYTDTQSVPGVDRFASCLDSRDECEEMAARLDALAKSGGTVLIAGGGLTAIEAACEFGERLPGLKIGMAPGRTFGPDDRPGGLSHAGFDHVVATLERLGVRVSAGARIVRVDADRAELENGGTSAFDLCLWAAGFLVPDLAARAGIACTESGEVITDETLTSTSHPNILAVGDAAHVVTGSAGECRMSCAAGRPMGELAAKTVAARLGGTTPGTFEFSYSFRCVSLGREDGLIQFVDAKDRPVEQVWTGERGAVWKEYICRRTLAGIGFESDLGPPPDTPPQIA
jgi:NADH:ubiquinone reductase (H+-translocating)